MKKTILYKWKIAIVPLCKYSTNLFIQENDENRSVSLKYNLNFDTCFDDDVTIGARIEV